MEDLIPLLVFAVVLIGNALKVVAEKRTQKPPDDDAEKSRPSPLERLLEQLALGEKPTPNTVPAKPQPTSQPPVVMESIDDEPLIPSELDTPPELMLLDDMQESSRPTTAPPRSVFAANHALRSCGGHPLGRIRRPGSSVFRITDRAALRKAMIGHIVLGPPRAFDLSHNDPIS